MHQVTYHYKRMLSDLFVDADAVPNEYQPHNTHWSVRDLKEEFKPSDDVI